MPRIPRFALPVLALAFAAASPALADEVRTRSGTVYEGRLVSETGTHYVLETRELGTLRIAKADVVEVRGPGREAPKPAPTAPGGPNAGGNAAPEPAPGTKPAPGSKPGDTAKPGSGKAAPETLDPAAIAAAAKARAEAERKAAEEAAALDAAQRMERRRATKIRRRTDPLPASGPAPAQAPAQTSDPVSAAPTAPVAPAAQGPTAPAQDPSSAAPATDPAGAPGTPEGAVMRKMPSGAAPGPSAAPTAPPEPEESDDRSSLGGALLANVAPGTALVLFEAPRTFEAAPGGIELGGRTFAHLETVGTASAWLTVEIGGKTERLSIRLAEVQRHVEVKAPLHRVRMLEGVSQGDWIRLTLDDGSVVEGRLAGLDGTTAVLGAPTDEGQTVEKRADLTKCVRLAGLLRNPSAQKNLADTELDEPIAVTSWPDGKMHVGRVISHAPGVVKLDVDGDRGPDLVFAIAGPLAEVRRIPGAAREKIREIKTGEMVRVRGFEEFPDARIERSWTGTVESVTAFAICLHQDDGAAVVPFDSLVSLEKVSYDPYRSQGAVVVPAAESGLRVLPGMPPAEAGSAPPGVSALNDGREVTHVYVAPPFDGAVFGVKVGVGVSEALSATDLEFPTEVVPKQDARGVRPREMVSESVPGLRVVVFVTPQDVVSAVEITRR